MRSALLPAGEKRELVAIAFDPYATALPSDNWGVLRAFYLVGCQLSIGSLSPGTGAIFAPQPAPVYLPAMRLKSEIFVSALLRRVFNLGGYAAVLRKGAEDAGAIFIRPRSRLGAETLYAPAPQSFFDGPLPGRLFEIRLQEADGETVEQAIAREIRFDPDCWVVEIEVESRGDLFDVTAEREG